MSSSEPCASTRGHHLCRAAVVTQSLSDVARGFSRYPLHVIRTDRDRKFLALRGVDDGQTVEFDFGHHALLPNKAPARIYLFPNANCDGSEHKDRSQKQNLKIWDQSFGGLAQFCPLLRGGHITPTSRALWS
jgi:hypothetical protein